MTVKPENKKCCPYWDKNTGKNCNLIESGLFIPTRIHVLQYCENSAYVNCIHYSNKSLSQEKLAGDTDRGQARNRRLYARIPVKEDLNIARHTIDSESNEVILDNRAKALDLSLGGMQIETRARLYVNQIISFTFDENFDPPLYKGNGEIRWIKNDRLSEDPGSAGLTFIDTKTMETIKKHLQDKGEKNLYLSGF